MIAFITLAASAALTAASPVTAGAHDLVRISVPYADLNLATAQGRLTFDDRVHAAAATICGDGDEGEIARTMEVYQCREGIFARARPQVAAAVTRAHELAALAAR